MTGKVHAADPPSTRADNPTDPPPRTRFPSTSSQEIGWFSAVVDPSRDAYGHRRPIVHGELSSYMGSYWKNHQKVSRFGQGGSGAAGHHQTGQK